MYPDEDQWALFERYKNCPPQMSPQTFLQRWHLDYPDLAYLVGVTRHTVAQWFSSGVGSRPARAHHFRRLATIDFLWRNGDRLPYGLLNEWCNISEVPEQTEEEDILENQAEDLDPPSE